MFASMFITNGSLVKVEKKNNLHYFSSSNYTLMKSALKKGTRPLKKCRKPDVCNKYSNNYQNERKEIRIACTSIKNRSLKSSLY